MGNCAKFNSPVTVSDSKWENTHGRPEEVCVPSAPAIDVTQHLAAYNAVSAGKMKATKKASKASECASDETFFWCQNNGKSTDKYDYCGDNSKCPVNGVHSDKCCYCGGCLKASLAAPPAAKALLTPSPTRSPTRSPARLPSAKTPMPA